jgi:hypothetical protein
MGNSDKLPHSRDPIVNVVYGQIQRSITVCLENQCWGAAVKLIYSGIDTMAFLGMRAKQQDVERADFIVWVNKYIQFPCKEQLTGMDLYGARCAMLHMNSVHSRLSRQGQCRLIGYMDIGVPEVIYRPKVDKNFVMVSVSALADAFFNGTHQFFIGLFSNADKAKIAVQRLQLLVHDFPTK